jgi:hypothetical protein
LFRCPASQSRLEWPGLAADVAIDQSGRYLATPVYSEDSLSVWDLRSGQLVHRLGGIARAEPDIQPEEDAFRHASGPREKTVPHAVRSRAVEKG